jgi:hypothetical protein
MTTTLNFFIREDNRDFPVSEMSEPEGAAIEECVEDLIPSRFESTVFWFETDTCHLDEDDVPYGTLRCFTHNPTPRNGSLLESRIPYPIPKEVLDALAGKTFVIRPPQYGVNPWGQKVEVTFEQKPKSGILASELIAAALKAQ